MKLSSTWKRRLIVGVAVASIPLTALADYYYEYFTTNSWGMIGGYYSSSSSSYYSYLGLLVVGNGNQWTFSNSYNSLVAGYYCNLYDSNSVVLGAWNKDSGGDERFVVGNGTNSTTKRNVMEILKTGTVKLGYPGPATGQNPAHHAIEIDGDGKTIRIVPQGDIGMGAFQ